MRDSGDTCAAGRWLGEAPCQGSAGGLGTAGLGAGGLVLGLSAGVGTAGFQCWGPQCWGRGLELLPASIKQAQNHTRLVKAAASR